MSMIATTPSNLLEKAIDATWKRNEVIADNIANADTPGFKKSYVKFGSVLKSALENNTVGMKTTRVGHFLNGPNGDLDEAGYTVVKSNGTSMREDGNNVDIDAEMSELAKNTIHYNALVTKLNKELARLRTAIEGR